MVGDALSENPKKFWSYIKSLRKDNSSVPTLKNKSGIPAATDHAKANALVNQFSSVFKKIFPLSHKNTQTCHISLLGKKGSTNYLTA